ncbi:hypothetical protein ACM15_27500, partial [Parabacteroides goldsteinii]
YIILLYIMGYMYIPKTRAFSVAIKLVPFGKLAIFYDKNNILKTLFVKYVLPFKTSHGFY